MGTPLSVHQYQNSQLFKAVLASTYILFKPLIKSLSLQQEQEGDSSQVSLVSYSIQTLVSVSHLFPTCDLSPSKSPLQPCALLCFAGLLSPHSIREALESISVEKLATAKAALSDQT